MDCRFEAGSFESLASGWRELQRKRQNSPIFVSPEWTEVWWQHFGSGAELLLGAVKCQDSVIGIAPLMIKSGVASFIGSTDVCDYLDFIVEPGSEESFFSTVLAELVKRGIRRLDLVSLRQDSAVLTAMVGIARERGWQVSTKNNGISVELNLPATWEEYLQMLTVKQRHELRRKMRRLSEAGGINFRVSEDAGTGDMDIFLRMFRDSRQDKADFLTPAMESFFRSLAATLAQRKLLTLRFMQLDALPVAAVMCFDYQNNVYLYNSGYDPSYDWLSVGLVSKAFCIRESIEHGKNKFDFLSGDEVYKYRLGGQELPLYRCRFSLET